MRTPFRWPWLVMAAWCMAVTAAQAAVLLPRDLDGNATNGHEAVYDPSTNLLWLRDAAGAGGGPVLWTTAEAWATATLNHGGGLYGLTDWRLPRTAGTDPGCSLGPEEGPRVGYGCLENELSAMFSLNLGGRDGSSVLDTAGATAEAVANLQLFSNLQAAGYWTSELWSPREAFVFDMSQGAQALDSVRDATHYAWAVRFGDAAPMQVPEPSALALLALGLAAACTMRRRKA